MRPILPRRQRRHAQTIRLRLTALYGCVFLITGAVLLTIGYLLVRHNLFHHHVLHEAALTQYQTRGQPAPQPRPQPYLSKVLRAVYAQAANNALHQLMLEYIGALVLMTAVSVGAGWLLAGRALAPLREITATARRVSGENLGERIALDGPQDELKELADTFDGMLERLDSAFASQRAFVANASHELRTPLTIMRTEVDVALADPDATSVDLRQMGEAVRETIDRSESLIAALLLLARSQAVTIQEQPVDLVELTNDALTALGPHAQREGVELISRLGPAVARGDDALLRRLVGNLIENAIRHNELGGHVRIESATGGQEVTLVVENTGPKLDPGQVEQLTQPFRRVNRAVGGFGLGLSIVASIVAAHDGRLDLAARHGGGLRATVTLRRERPGLVLDDQRPPAVVAS